MKLFKDMYKRANDAISTDEAYNRIMLKLEKPPVNTKRRRAAEIAALAACFIFTFAAVNVYNRYKELPKNSEIIAEHTQNPQSGITKMPENTDTASETDTVAESGEAAVVPQDKKADGAAVPKNTTTAKTEDVKTTASPKAEKATEETAAAGKSAEEKVAADAAAVPQEQHKEVALQEKQQLTEIKLNSLNSSGGGASAAALRIAEEQDVQVRKVTKDEYYKYLGRNIEQEVIIPDGFASTTQDMLVMELDGENNFADDRWSFIFQNNEKAVEIITTKDTESVQMYIDREDYLKSTVCGIDVVVLNDAAYYKAYIVSQDIGYMITGYGIEMSDLEKLLVSVAE